MSDKAKTLLVICGPTAAGKSDVALRVAQRLKTEIVSADSRQVYREIPIGTAQPNASELALVPHHFVASRSIHEDYDAGTYAREALTLLESLFQNHETIVMCGGTGLYIKAVCEGLDEVPPSDIEVRTQLNNRLIKDGLNSLLNQLQQLDVVHYNRMDRKNPQRVLRALEVCLVSGKPFSSFHTKQAEPRPFNVVKIGIQLPKKELDERIAKRTLAMMNSGWLKEAQSVFPFRHLNALNTVGYKELFDHLDGKTSLDDAVKLIQLHTAQFAKRQLTWFKKDETVQWMPQTEAYRWSK